MMNGRGLIEKPLVLSVNGLMTMCFIMLLLKRQHMIYGKKLEGLYDRKSATNKAFMFHKLVNLKYKEGSPIPEHLNEIKSIVNQLASMKIVFDDELQALMLLSSLPES